MSTQTKTKKKNTQTECANILENPYNSFRCFFLTIFSYAIKKVEGEFEPGKHMINWCSILQVYTRTSFVAPRYHLKSTVMLGYLAWKIYRMEKEYNEWLFLGFRRDLAMYQLKRLKRYIKNIPEMSEYQDMTKADSIVYYQYKGRQFICEPEGIFTANRGRHPNGMIVDDILKDPEVKLDISQLVKVQKLFLEEFEQMPKEECHVVGTPQDREDIFAKFEKMDSYYSRRWQAVSDFKEGTVLWPEKFNFKRLMEIKQDIGDKAFNKEYMCKPVRGEEGYFSDEELAEVTYRRLKNRNIYKDIKLNEFTYGGLDIGKKRHPSHLVVYGKSRAGNLIQLVSIWMEHRDYVDQVKTCYEAIKTFNIFKLYYDDTRAEFEGFREIGELPPQMKGINFTQKIKFQMAAEFEKKVRNKTIKLLPEERQKRQILNCDNDLKSMETSEGHGDSFWSNSLAVHASADSGVNIRFL